MTLEEILDWFIYDRNQTNYPHKMVGINLYIPTYKIYNAIINKYGKEFKYKDINFFVFEPNKHYHDSTSH